LWTGECQDALDTLCQQLTSHRVLRVPSEGQPYILHTDSSGKAAKASLGQLDESGVEQLCVLLSLAGKVAGKIAYISRWFSDEKKAVSEL